MDVLRPDLVVKKRRLRMLVLLAAVAALVTATVMILGFEPAPPSVKRDAVWIGTVERGELVRQVRGSGHLEPEEVRWIILAHPGDYVSAEETVVVLSNPEVVQAAAVAAGALRRTEAELDSLRAELRSGELNDQASAAAIAAEYEQALLRAEADRELAEKGLISTITLKVSESMASSLATRTRLEHERTHSMTLAHKAQLEAKLAQVEQERALYRLRQQQLEALSVQAGLTGVVQEIPVEVGQQVAAGTIVARLAAKDRLKAVLRLPATEAQDVTIGQPAAIDTRHGVVGGTVERINPRVEEGAVLVEVPLHDAVPRGARPDLSIDGTVELEHISDTVYVARPVFGKEHAETSLYRLDKDGSCAELVRVQLGRSSDTAIEVVEGLDPGDQVVLSDMTRWHEHDRICLDH